MSMPNRTRKDVRALKPAQRQRFFFCLKMLMVLPPQEKDNLRDFYVAWQVHNGQAYYKAVKPRNMHDEFISSHQTSCEHGEPYFAYYHRHLLICVEIALNYAEEVLIGGRDRLPKQLYDAHSSHFEAVFSKYQDILTSFRKEQGLKGDSLPTLSMHYWNPVDYTQSITIPEELKERTPDEMDQLCFSVNEHYPWNFNFASRWFNEQGYIPRGFQTNGYFVTEPTYYTEAQRNIILGKSNPRDNDPDAFFSSSLDRYGTLLIGDQAAEVNGYHNYRSLNRTGNTIDVCTLDQKQLDTLFGSSAMKLQWISSEERAAMKTNFAKTRSYAYNKALPHFQYAYSLFKEPNTFFRNYISTYNQAYDNSMENCHNTCHNNLQRFMSDAQLSITHPIFFLFHSWVDLALETKIRMIRNSKRNDMEYRMAKLYLSNIKSYSILNQVVSTERPITLGEYPIFEWVVPLSRLRDRGIQLKTQDYQAAFPGEAYVLNPQLKAIRRSDQLHSFYQLAYLPAHGHRYNYFHGLSNFNFNFDFQLLQYNSQGAEVIDVMAGSNVPIPTYITSIYESYKKQWNNNKVRNIWATQQLRSSKHLATPRKTTKEGQQPTNLKVKQTESVEREEETVLRSQPPAVRTSIQERGSQALDINHLSEEDYYNQKDLLAAIRESFAGFATYSSSIRSIVISIQLNMTEEGFKEIPLTSDQREIMTEGLIISIIPLFTRGSGAAVCPNCKAEKQLLIECTENLAEMNEELFCALAKGLNRELIFQLKDNQPVNLSRPRLKDMLRLDTPKPVFNQLVILEGANEMSFTVKFHGKEDYQSSAITINGYSYSVVGKLANIVSRKTFKLNCSVDMPVVVTIADKDEASCHNLYRKVKVFMTNGAIDLQFQYDIVTFHKLIRYQIDIYQHEREGQIYYDATVKDMDFQFKQIHYSRNQYQL